jgi:hypothetical protein
MPHSTNLTFDLVELHGLKWFNFPMRPTMFRDSEMKVPSFVDAPARETQTEPAGG